MAELYNEESAFEELASITLADRSLEEVLRMVTELASAVVPGAEDVSVTLIEQGRPRTAVFAGKLSAMLDERQYAAGYGPCVDAAVTTSVVLVPDTADDSLYPDFSRQAAKHGIGAVIGIGLAPGTGAAGALNVYARDVSVFSDAAQAALMRFAAYASTAVANATAYRGAVLQVEQLKEAIASRAVIEQAKGIIMYLRKCDADEAFTILRTTSMDHNEKLRDIATRLVRQSTVQTRTRD